jgi:hypothetical protein
MHAPSFCQLASFEIFRLVKRCGTQRAAAVEMEISTNYLSDLINGHRVCSDRILGKLDLRRVIIDASTRDVSS